VQADVRFRQHRHAGHAAVRGEVVQVDVQERRSGGGYRLAQRFFDVVGVVETAGIPEVDQEMRTRKDASIAFDEVILF